MKQTIIISMDASLSFKFIWKEKGSFVSHEGSILKPEQRHKKSGVVRIDCSRNWTDDNNKEHWDSRVHVPYWIKSALDWAFLKYEDRIGQGIEFSITCFMNGDKPQVEGLPEKQVDQSWKNELPSGSSKTFKKGDKPATTSTTTASVEDAKEAARQRRAAKLNS